MKHLLKMSDLKRKDISAILALADQLKYNQKHGLDHKKLDGKLLGMIFRKSSTRTRVSFEAGILQLGGHAIVLTDAESQLGRGEPIRDTARVLGRYVDGIMIRTFAQKEAEELAEYAGVPVINGLTDYAHPCQILADLMTIRERLTALEGVKVCWVGDGNNVCNSLIVGALCCGMELRVACPKGYEPHEAVLAEARQNPLFTLCTDPREAAKGADVVFTDVFTSMGQEAERVKRMGDFGDYQVNKELLGLMSKNAMVQHCLPAHRGEEITEDVFEAHASEIFEEAENRLHVQKAVMVLCMGESDFLL